MAEERFKIRAKSAPARSILRAQMVDPEAPRPGLFPDTRWTLVLAARHDPAKRRRALDELVRPRWKALYVLARKRGLSEAEAEDAVQSFFARLVEGDLLERLDPGKGSLRAYLKTAFAHHLMNLHASARAEKRGGGLARADLQELEPMLALAAPSAEELFDRAWALQIFQEALGELEREFTSGARRGPFEVLRNVFGFETTAPYAELAKQYGMSVPQLKAFVHRARLRFRQMLKAKVIETLPDPQAAESELNELLKAMAA